MVQIISCIFVAVASVRLAMPNKVIQLSHLGDKYLFRFYQFGQSVNPSVISNTTDNAPENFIHSCSRFSCQVLPSLCFCIVVITVALLSFHNFSLIHINFDNIIYCVFISCAFTTSLMALQQTPLFSNQSNNLWTALTNYEDFVWQRLQIKMTFGDFCQKYHLYASISGCLFFALMLAKIVFRIDETNYIRQVAALILIFSTLMINFQILFYVSLFAYMIEFINQHIVDVSCEIECGSDAERSRKFTATFRSYKLVYYKLWEISQLINETYGWIIMSLLMQNANNTIQPFYWVIVELHEDDIPSNLRILSNYSIKTSIDQYKAHIQ